jgi:uracil-DNA glycosylase
MAKIRAALRTLLHHWRDDLSPAWSSALDGAEPDFEAVDPELTLDENEVIFPARKGHPPAGARSDAHIFRAFDGITPDDVCVVVIGQDPYTKVQQATGRSFEQGDLANWLGQPKVTPSLKRIIQAVALHRTGRTKYTSSTGWSQLVGDLNAGTLQIEPARPLWDHWQEQGVMFINAILTFNRFVPAYQFKVHQPLWAPVIRQLLRHLVNRADRPLVCVAWGAKAQSALATAGVQAMAEAAGTWNTAVRIVSGPHPNAPPPGSPPFLTGPDRFAEVNSAVTATGGQAISW